METMTRLGFVGVGKHAQKMAAAFRDCGAEVVAYDRAACHACDSSTLRSFPLDGFGLYRQWQEQLANPAIGALIICAPPEVTTEVALACAKAGKRCVATKPLMVSNRNDLLLALDPKLWQSPDPHDVDRDIYVDLWRLYSPAWQAMKAELRGKRIESLWINFYGDGPERQFSPALDWGPHALAFVRDLLPVDNSWKSEKISTGLWRLSNRTIALGVPGDTRILFGNECPLQTSPRRMVITFADGKEWTWSEENDEHVLTVGRESVMRHDRSLALRNFCRSFLAGEPSDTLRTSCEAMKVLMPLAMT